MRKKRTQNINDKSVHFIKNLADKLKITHIPRRCNDSKLIDLQFEKRIGKRIKEEKGKMKEGKNLLDSLE